MIVHKKPLKVLVFAPSLIPSVVIGVLRPLVELEKRGEVILRLRYASIQVGASVDIAWCDVGVFCRNSEVSDLDYLYQLKRAGKRIIYEIDDNFEEIPLNTPISIYHRKFHRLHALKRFYGLADITRVYSHRLKERAESHGANVRLIRSYFDTALIAKLPPPAKSSKVKIAYPTNRIDDPRLEHMFFDALKIILKKHRDKIEIHFWRKNPPSQLAGLTGLVLNQPIGSYEAFVKSFYSKGFDIGLAPLVDEPFFHSKSNNKYREFGGCGIAGIYSDMPPYSDSVTNEKTGILVANTVQSWVDAIDRLILDKTLRHRIVLNAKIDVDTNYNFESAVDSFLQSLKEVTCRLPDGGDWLYPENLRLLCAFVGAQLDETANMAALDSARWDSFVKSVHTLNGKFLPRMEYTDILEKPETSAACNVVVYVVDTKNDLEQAAISFPLCQSVILDLSQFRSSSEDFRSTYERFQISVPVSLALDQKQDALISIAKEMELPFTLVNRAVTPLENNYSLKGYKAVFIDLIERHYRYGKSMKEPGIRTISKRIGNRFFTICDFYSGRVTRAWALLQWRLGRRPM